jgi:hypothetical protein
LFVLPVEAGSRPSEAVSETVIPVRLVVVRPVGLQAGWWVGAEEEERGVRR